MLGLIGEIGLEHDHGVAARIAGATRGLTAQCVDRGGVPDARATEHAERHHLVVGRQRLGGGVGAAVVVHEHLVLPRLLLEHLAQAPDEKANGGCFVVGGDAEIQHEILDARGRAIRKLGT